MGKRISLIASCVVLLASSVALAQEPKDYDCTGTETINGKSGVIGFEVYYSSWNGSEYLNETLQIVHNIAGQSLNIDLKEWRQYTPTNLRDGCTYNKLVELEPRPDGSYKFLLIAECGTQNYKLDGVCEYDDPWWGL